MVKKKTSRRHTLTTVSDCSYGSHQITHKCSFFPWINVVKPFINRIIC